MAKVMTLSGTSKCTGYKVGGAVVLGVVGASVGRAVANKWGYQLSTTLPWGIIGTLGGGIPGVLVGLYAGKKLGKCSR